MKRVHIRSCSPLAVSREVEVGWEDLWLRVHSGRRTLRLAPCLVSYEDLLSDIQRAQEAVDEGREWAQKDLVTLEAIRRDVDANGYAVDQAPRTTRKGEDPGRTFALANVFTKQPWISRVEAERMLDFYLGVLGLRHCAYKWKTPKFVVVPVTIPRQAA